MANKRIKDLSDFGGGEEGFVVVDSEANGTGKKPIADLEKTKIYDVTKPGNPVIKNLAYISGYGDIRGLGFDSNAYYLLSPNFMSYFQMDETSKLPFLITGVSLKDNGFRSLKLRPVFDNEDNFFGFVFENEDGSVIPLFGNEDTYFGGVNIGRPGTLMLRYKLKGNPATQSGCLLTTDVMSGDMTDEINGAGILAFKPNFAGMTNYVITEVNGVDENGNFGRYFKFGKAAIPSLNNPKKMGKIVNPAGGLVFGKFNDNVGWWELPDSQGSSSGDNVLVVDVFINSYASTITGGNKTYTEIKAAFDAGKLVVIRAQDTRSDTPQFDPYADTEIYVLGYYNNESDIFEFVSSGVAFRNIPSANDPLYGNNKQVNFSNRLLTLWKRNSEGETQDTWRLYDVSQQQQQLQFQDFTITETADNVWESITSQQYMLLRMSYNMGQLIRFKITRYDGTVIYEPQVSFTEHAIHLTFTSDYTNVSYKVVDIAEDGTVSTHTN